MTRLDQAKPVARRGRPATSSGGAAPDVESKKVRNLPSSLLVRTPVPHPREALLGYALRLSECNGYSTPGYFLSPADDQLHISRHRLVDHLRSATGLTEAQLDRLRNSKPDEKDAKFGFLLSQRVSLYDLNLKCPRVCTQCLQENGRAEALWDLAWVSACPIHACELIIHCPACAGLLTWSRPGLLKCKLGHDLATSVPRPAGASHVRVAALLGRKLYGSTSELSKLEGADRTDDMSLYEVCRVAGKLTNHLAKQKRGSKSNVRGRLRLAAQDDLMQAICDLFLGSDAECFALFDRLSVDASAGGRHRSYHDAFNWLFDLFPRDRAAESMPSLLRLLFAYASEHWPDSRLRRTSAHFSGYVQDSKWMSVAAAVKELGVSEPTLRDAILRGEVPSRKVSDKSNHNHIVPIAWIQEQLAAPMLRLDNASIKHRFALTSSIIVSLRDRGLFIPNIRVRQGRFLEHDVQTLAERMAEHATEQQAAATAQQITFDELMCQRSSKAAKANFVASVLQGHVRPCARIEAAGLPGLLFDRKLSLRQLLLGESDLSMDEVMQVLDCYGAKGLLTEGHLKISTISKGRAYVTISSVMEFDQQFVSPRILLAEADISIPTLLRVARQAQITLLPVADLNRDGKIWFVPRGKLQAMREALVEFRTVYPPRRRAKARMSGTAATVSLDRPAG